MGEEVNFARMGFVGLGAMGRPMLIHLANKLPAESQIHIFDVVEEVVDELCDQFPERVLKAASSKDVALQAVST
jgi:3-hydroxyisobutyrate dehydrogenase-like beta-hydroxyacid dehydrogenase